MIQPQVGELLVGAYLRLVEDAELVTYNQRSKEEGLQTELDVLAVKSAGDRRTVFGCEVITHLRGARYSGTPSGDDWAEYESESYRYTLERLWKKFTADAALLAELFGDADDHVLQLWAPRVSRGPLTDGLGELQQRFETEHGHRIELVINEEYTARIDELRRLAAGTKKSYDEPAFRFLQILEHLREP